MTNLELTKLEKRNAAWKAAWKFVDTCEIAALGITQGLQAIETCEEARNLAEACEVAGLEIGDVVRDAEAHRAAILAQIFPHRRAA